MISAIVAVDNDWGIGFNGELLERIPDDLKYFKKLTENNVVVMGRKTWESLPGKLPGRINIVVSRNPVEGADEWVQDLANFIDENKDTEEEIFVIGGGMVYFETLKYAKRLYLTEVDVDAPEADSFFPMFDRSKYHKKLIKKGDKWQIWCLSL